jgi:hypothetical protein
MPFCPDIDATGIVVATVNGYEVLSDRQKFHVRSYGFYPYVNAPTREAAESYAASLSPNRPPTPDGTMVPCGYCGTPYPFKRGSKPVCASCYLGR